MIVTPSKNGNRFVPSFLLHIHPRRVQVETLRFTLSFGLGGMSATLILLLFITGILQILSYSPDIGVAYDSVEAMYTRGNLSGWTRNIHYWSGNLLVVLVTLHCLRVYLTGAASGSRRRNWYIGLLLLGLVVFANFSGYLLPWDQLAFWAVTIFTNMVGYIPLVGEDIVHLLRGGSEIGPATLTNFYALHTAWLPLCLVCCLIYHFWVIRKNGGLIRRENSTTRSPDSVPVIPHLIVREGAVGLGLVATVLFFAALFDAPLDEMANPGMSPNPAKAAWFFMGLQELLMHLHPIFAICIIPILALCALIFIPCIGETGLPGGYWFGGQRGRRLALQTTFCSVCITFALVILDEVVKNGSEGAATDVITRGVIPVTGLLLLYGSSYYLLTQKLKYTRAEAVMAGFIFSVTAVICLTVTGIWLRGPGMQLTFFI